MPLRFPRRLYERGSEPDPRFTLANERTFLAWTSFSLAILATGVALDVIAVPAPRVFTFLASLLLLVLGVVTPAVAWVQWMRTEAALREDRPLPASNLMPIVALLLTLVGIVLLVGVMMGR
jgi:putative membrane protein